MREEGDTIVVGSLGGDVEGGDTVSGGGYDTASDVGEAMGNPDPDPTPSDSGGATAKVGDL